MLLGAKMTWNFHPWERKCHGTSVAPVSEKVVELLLSIRNTCMHPDTDRDNQ